MAYYLKEPGITRIAIGYHEFRVDDDGKVIGLEKHPELIRMLSGLIETREGVNRKCQSQPCQE